MAKQDKCILCGIGDIYWVYNLSGTPMATLECLHCGAKGTFKQNDKECVCDPYIGFTCPHCLNKKE